MKTMFIVYLWIQIEVLKQNYMKYLDGIKDAEHLKMILKTERGVHTPLMKV